MGILTAMPIFWRAGAVALFVCVVSHAGAIYALQTPLGPALPGEAASATVILDQDVVSTLTLNFAYQFQSRFVLGGGLSSGGTPILTAGGLPLLSSFGSPTTIVVDNGLAAALTGQSVLVQLTTTAGDLTGGGSLILTQRQGGGPPFPPFDTPEPATSVLIGGGFVILAAMRRVFARRKS